VPKRSAGILLYRRAGGRIEILLVHPGGPFWAKKGEDTRAVALREFEEETGMRPQGDPVPLGELLQPSRKTVTVWALEGDFDVATLRSNEFEFEWPPRSGRKANFPEVDRAEWFSPAQARIKILRGQKEFIARLLAAIGCEEPRTPE
jgi:predicted NUDIX family NTP pyrophosphohydrolase